MINAHRWYRHEQMLTQLTDEAGVKGIVLLTEHIAQCELCREAEHMVRLLLAQYREQELPPISAAMEQRILTACCNYLSADRRNDNADRSQEQAIMIDMFHRLGKGRETSRDVN